MTEYKVILDTKFVGITTAIIKAKNDDEAIKKAKRFENQYNTVKRIIRFRKKEA